MSKKNEIHIEGMADILETLGISATKEQVEKTVEGLLYGLEIEREVNFTPFLHHKEVCSECENLKDTLKRVTHERDVYHDSVCERRNTKEVWIEGDTVKYNPR